MYLRLEKLSNVLLMTRVHSNHVNALNVNRYGYGQCVDDGKLWDYFELITGTFIAHPGSPWQGLKGEIHQHGCSTQRGWGANLFNLQYGLFASMAGVITQKPNNVTEFGSL